MTALTADNDLIYRDGVELPLPVAAGEVIYANAFVCADDGYAVPGADEAGLLFRGIAVRRVDNMDGEAGDLSVSVRRKGVVHVEISGVTQANLGEAVYVLDDATLGLTGGSTNKVWAGVIVGLDGADALVDIEPAAALMVRPAAWNHDHDADYAAIDHNHDGVYEPAT